MSDFSARPQPEKQNSAPAQEDGAKRLFVALELLEESKQALAALKKELPGLRWVPAQNLHLTLLFLGTMPAQSLPGLHQALAAIQASPFAVRIDRLGLFDGKNQSVLWAGLAPSPELVLLHSAVALALQPLTGQKNNQGRFTPHITLARGKGRATPAMRALCKQPFACKAFTINGFTLFSSLLLPGGAVHRPERQYAFMINNSK